MRNEGLLWLLLEGANVREEMVVTVGNDCHGAHFVLRERGRDPSTFEIQCRTLKLTSYPTAQQLVEVAKRLHSTRTYHYRVRG